MVLRRDRRRCERARLRVCASALTASSPCPTSTLQQAAVCWEDKTGFQISANGRSEAGGVISWFELDRRRATIPPGSTFRMVRRGRRPLRGRSDGPRARFRLPFSSDGPARRAASAARSGLWSRSLSAICCSSWAMSGSRIARLRDALGPGADTVIGVRLSIASRGCRRRVALLGLCVAWSGCKSQAQSRRPWKSYQGGVSSSCAGLRASSQPTRLGCSRNSFSWAGGMARS